MWSCILDEGTSLVDTAPHPARLTVIREDRKDVGTRQIVLSIDGERFATLLHGQRATREIAPGRHRLRAHNTLVWKTVEFDARPGEQVRFTAVNRAGLGSMALVALFGAGPLYVTLERLPGDVKEEGMVHGRT